jgi:hypothetical protein
MTLRTLALVLLLGVGSGALSGCVAAVVAGAGAGAGAVVYIQGEHQQVHDAKFESVWTATVNSLKQMQITPVKTTKDALGGSIEAKRADNTAVGIVVEPVGGGATRVKIRIGNFGDKAASELIQAKISANLGGK